MVSPILFCVLWAASAQQQVAHWPLTADGVDTIHGCPLTFSSTVPFTNGSMCTNQTSFALDTRNYASECGLAEALTEFTFAARIKPQPGTGTNVLLRQDDGHWLLRYSIGAENAVFTLELDETSIEVSAAPRSDGWYNVILTSDGYSQARMMLSVVTDDERKASVTVNNAGSAIPEIFVFGSIEAGMGGCYADFQFWNSVLTPQQLDAIFPFTAPPPSPAGTANSTNTTTSAEALDFAQLYNGSLAEGLLTEIFSIREHIEYVCPYTTGRNTHILEDEYLARIWSRRESAVSLAADLVNMPTLMDPPSDDPTEAYKAFEAYAQSGKRYMVKWSGFIRPTESGIHGILIPNWFATYSPALPQWGRLRVEHNSGVYETWGRVGGSEKEEIMLFNFTLGVAYQFEAEIIVEDAVRSPWALTWFLPDQFEADPRDITAFVSDVPRIDLTPADLKNLGRLAHNSQGRWEWSFLWPAAEQWGTLTDYENVVAIETDYVCLWTGVFCSTLRPGQQLYNGTFRRRNQDTEGNVVGFTHNLREPNQHMWISFAAVTIPGFCEENGHYHWEGNETKIVHWDLSDTDVICNLEITPEMRVVSYRRAHLNRMDIFVEDQPLKLEALKVQRLGPIPWTALKLELPLNLTMTSLKFLSVAGVDGVCHLEQFPSLQLLEFRDPQWTVCPTSDLQIVMQDLEIVLMNMSTHETIVGGSESLDFSHVALPSLKELRRSDEPHQGDDFSQAKALLLDSSTNQLEVLHLPHTHLTSLPASLAEIPSLWYVNVSESPDLESLPFFGANSLSLTHLILSGSVALSLLPPEIGLCPRLEVLHCEGCPLLSVPANLAASTTLREVLFEGGLFSTLVAPASPVLEVFSVRNSGLVNLTSDFIGAINLRTLIISNAELQRVPPISNAPLLTTIDLSSNKISSTCEEVLFAIYLPTLGALSELRLGSNRITGPIPDVDTRSWPILDLLDLHDNEITSFTTPPLEDGWQTVADIESDHESKFQVLPPSWRTLSLSKHLDLRWNQLRGFWPASVSGESSTLISRGNDIWCKPAFDPGCNSTMCDYELCHEVRLLTTYPAIAHRQTESTIPLLRNAAGVSVLTGTHLCMFSTSPRSPLPCLSDADCPRSTDTCREQTPFPVGLCKRLNEPLATVSIGMNPTLGTCPFAEAFALLPDSTVSEFTLFFSILIPSKLVPTKLVDSPKVVGPVAMTARNGCPGGQELRAPLCFPCTINTFSLGVLDSTWNGSSPCLPCGEGTFSGIAASQCVGCSRGSAIPEGANTCEQCALGRFDNGTVCHPCPTGRYQSEAGQTRCFGCLPGTYAANAGAESCDACSSDSFSNAFNATECSACPVNSQASGGSKFESDCLCTKDFWRPDNRSRCNQCPEGAVCLGFDIPLYALPGYWTTGKAGEFVRCIPEVACLGGLRAPGQSPCLEGYTGEYCSKCVPLEFFKLNGLCARCPRFAEGMWVLAVLVFIAVCLGLLKLGQPSATPVNAIRIVVGNVQLIGIYASFPVSWPSKTTWIFDLFSFANFNVELFSPECSVELTFWAKWIFKLLLPLFMAMAFGLIWLLARHSTVKSWLLRFITADITGTITSTLMRRSEQTHETRERDRTQKFAQQNNLALASAEWDGRFVYSYMSVLSLAYVFLTHTAAQPFNCVPLTSGGGSTYVIHDAPQENCFDDAWWAMVPLSILALLIFTAGIPALLLFLLIRNRRKLTTRDWKARFGSITIPYKEQLFFWELISMVRKCSIILLIDFYSKGNVAAQFTQINLTLAVEVVYLVAQAFCSPFVHSWDNRLGFVWSAASILTLFQATMFLTSALDSAQKDSYAIGLIIALIFCVLITCYVLYCTFNLKKSRNNYVRISGLSEEERELEEKALLDRIFASSSVSLSLWRRNRDLSPDGREAFYNQLLGLAPDPDAQQKPRRDAVLRVTMDNDRPHGPSVSLRDDESNMTAGLTFASPDFETSASSPGEVELPPVPEC